MPELPPQNPSAPPSLPSPPSALLALPLFPLGTVLFPGGSLPLRIFEVRYLDMIGKCHKAGAPFGVVSLTHGSEVQKPAPGAAFAPESFQSVGTLATITEFATPQPGFMVIRCTGTQRFRIERQERLPYGLWIADVVRISDDALMAVPHDLQQVADALNALITSLKARGAPPGQLPFQPPYQLGDCAWVANRWCELLPLPPAQKQQLMALENPLVRLELVGDMLARAGIVVT
jgi:Lon protease-like protein